MPKGGVGGGGGDGGEKNQKRGENGTDSHLGVCVCVWVVENQKENRGHLLGIARLGFRREPNPRVVGWIP